MYRKLILNKIHKILYKVLFKGNVKHIKTFLPFAPHFFPHYIVFIKSILI